MLAEMILRGTVVWRYLGDLRASSKIFTKRLVELGGEGDDAKYLRESLSVANTAIKQWEKISMDRIILADKVWGASILVGAVIGLGRSLRWF